jgi:hypothetical protein
MFFTNPRMLALKQIVPYHQAISGPKIISLIYSNLAKISAPLPENCKNL